MEKYRLKIGGKNAFKASKFILFTEVFRNQGNSLLLGTICEYFSCPGQNNFIAPTHLTLLSFLTLLEFRKMWLSVAMCQHGMMYSSGYTDLREELKIQKDN